MIVESEARMHGFVIPSYGMDDEGVAWASRRHVLPTDGDFEELLGTALSTPDWAEPPNDESFPW